MRTNSYVRSLVKIRAIMVCLAIAGIAGLVFCASDSVAEQLGQITTARTEIPPAPAVHLGELFR
jgi:hypothetical protein